MPMFCDLWLDLQEYLIFNEIVLADSGFCSVTHRRDGWFLVKLS
jgi:hypothetical protein